MACGCLGLAAVGIPALANGASPAPPTATSAAATNISATGATANGSVNPNGQETEYGVQWGPTTGYGHETQVSSAGSGTTAQSISEALSGLNSGTTYHYRVIAINQTGTSVGSDESFTTTGTAPAPSAAPTATTGAADSVSSDAAHLTGTENANGQATQYYFEYGPTSNYGFETSPQPASGSTAGSATAWLNHLQPGTTYHYRLVAASAGGTALGADKTFTTAAGTAPTQSYVKFMGRMGFVSPGNVIGVEAGCIGDTTCTGHVTMTVAGTNTVLAQRNYSIPADTGGFQNMKISNYGASLLKHNGVWKLLQVQVNVKSSSGQTATEKMSLARWYWKSQS